MKPIRFIICVILAGAHSAALADSGQDADADTGASGKRITMQCDMTEIGTVLRDIADQGGLSLIVGPGVKGKVIVSLDNIPVVKALRAIAETNGFRYVQAGDIIAIAMPVADAGAAQRVPTITRVITLRSKDAADIKDVLEHLLTPKVGHMMVIAEDSGTEFVGQELGQLTDYQEAGSTNTQQQQPLVPIQTADPTRNSKTLIVTDVEEVVELISRLVADLDRPEPQVLIEARLVEMSTNLQRQLGIDWNIEVFANGPLLNHRLPLNGSAGFATGTQIQRTLSGIAQNVPGLALGTIDFTRFNAVLRANQDDNSVRLLANPRMLIHNNHNASILVGERYPLFEANITDFGTLTEAFDQYIPIGIQLKIKPTIMPDGRVSMHVQAAISSLGDDVIGTTGLRVARINTREVNTRVIMRDEQTIVIGGLISDRKVHSVSKVPFLGDLPILSALFRQENPRSERVDLLVFLTARIDGALQLADRDREIFDKYRPHFKHVERLQDVPLHFEIPTEYEPPRPMFSEPPIQPDINERGGCSSCGDKSCPGCGVIVMAPTETPIIHSSTESRGEPIESSDIEPDATDSTATGSITAEVTEAEATAADAMVAETMDAESRDIGPAVAELPATDESSESAPTETPQSESGPTEPTLTDAAPAQAALSQALPRQTALPDPEISDAQDCAEGESIDSESAESTLPAVVPVAQAPIELPSPVRAEPDYVAPDNRPAPADAVPAADAAPLAETLLPPDLDTLVAEFYDKLVIARLPNAAGGESVDLAAPIAATPTEGAAPVIGSELMGPPAPTAPARGSRDVIDAERVLIEPENVPIDAAFDPLASIAALSQYLPDSAADPNAPIDPWLDPLDRLETGFDRSLGSGAVTLNPTPAKHRIGTTDRLVAERPHE